MTRMPTQPPEPRVLGRTELEAVIRKISERIEELNVFDLANIKARGDAGAEALESRINATLAETFGQDTAEYLRHTVGPFDSLPMLYNNERYAPKVLRQAYAEEIEEAKEKLLSLNDQLRKRLEGLRDAQSPFVPAPDRLAGGRVFIVHGRDSAAKESAARFITQLGHNPIILHEQASAGRTIIEKIEQHLNVAFAIVLLTPDDVGGIANDPGKLRPRARQNVVLELGLFIGVLGRKRVCALCAGELELPSDIDGVVYVPMDAGGGWRLLLAKEMKEAGLSVDLNRAI